MNDLRLIGLAMALGSSLAACAQNRASPSSATGSPKAVLVELFTSEGCSSCPPADALLRKLDGTRTAGGKLIVGLGEHVTYWNGLGWKDRFSADVYTARQQAYGDRFRLDGVYTPQVVVDGQAQLVGSDEAGLLKAVAVAKASGVWLEIPSVRLVEGKVAVEYLLRGPVPAGAEVWVAVADDRATTEVKRGENGGRVLEHAAIARSLVRAGPATTGGAAISLPVPEGLAGQEKAGRHVVVFVQEAGSGRVLAVESRPL